MATHTQNPPGSSGGAQSLAAFSDRQLMERLVANSDATLLLLVEKLGSKDSVEALLRASLAK